MNLIADGGVIAFLFWVIALLFSLTIHEFAHAWVADHLGDSTPRLAGRLTLNPLAHLDPIGAIALLLIGFGWGKPVPIDYRALRYPVLDTIQVALAGPFANLAGAVMIGLIARLLPLPEIFQVLAILTVNINLVLMIFNLLPIPPLDGSHFLELILPREIYALLEQYGMLFLIFFFVLSAGGGSTLLEKLFTNTVVPLSRIILGS